MNTGEKIKNILIGLLLIAAAFVLIYLEEDGYKIVVVILAISLILMGIRHFIYYFTMARHMVGGKTIFYTGLLIFDLGLFTMALYQIPQFYISIYLFIVFAFAGAIDVLRSFEMKNYGSDSWKRKMIFGLIEVALALLCLIFIKSTFTVVLIYSVGLVINAVRYFIKAFKKQNNVYNIQ